MLTRRSFLSSVAGAAAAALAGCSPSDGTRGSAPAPPDCPALEASGDSREPLWQTALRRGIIYGSSTATWQLSDAGYRRLFARESAILFTEDDLLWYRLRPTPKSGLDFNYSDRIVSFANRQRMLIVGAHLVWDEGFGDGWTDDDLWGMDEQTARDVFTARLTLLSSDIAVRSPRGSSPTKCSTRWDCAPTYRGMQPSDLPT